MTRWTVLVLAVLGTAAVTSTAVLAGQRDGNPERGYQTRRAATRPNGRAHEAKRDKLSDQNSRHEPRRSICAYPNYYGMYPKYYVGADGRGHFCDSWAPSNFER